MKKLTRQCPAQERLTGNLLIGNLLIENLLAGNLLIENQAPWC